MKKVSSEKERKLNCEHLDEDEVRARVVLSEGFETVRKVQVFGEVSLRGRKLNPGIERQPGKRRNSAMFFSIRENAQTY
jgi:hypothetical protein